MITEHDLAEAIAECQGQRNPTSSTCLKLAALYTIKDKMYPDKEPLQQEAPERAGVSQYSYAEAPPRSEFMQAIVNTDADEFLSVMDELMTTLKAMIPRLYDGVMRKLTKE